MSPASDAEVIGRSLGEPEAFGLIYDRHAATLLRFLGRRVGAEVAEGLAGELFRIAFERRRTFDRSRESALPWLYGIGANLLLKHRRGEARRLRASATMAAARDARDGRASATAAEARVLFARVAGAIEALPDGEREALLLFAWEDLPYQGVAEALELPVVLPVIGYLGMAAFFGWPGIVFGLLIQISRGLGDVLFLNALNEKISLAFRATLLSVAQLGTRASFALMGPLVGYGIDAWGLASVLSALGILSAVVFVLLLLPLVLRDLPQTSADSLTGQPAAR